MKAREGFILRNLVGEHLLMPVGANIKTFQGVIRMNELSVFVWNHLRTDTSRQNLLSAILDEYDIDEATAAADLDEILSKMIACNLLEV